MKLTNRNILLVIGIVVAVVVTLTTLVYQDKAAAAEREVPVPKKTSWNSTAHRLLDFVTKRVEIKKIH